MTREAKAKGNVPMAGPAPAQTRVPAPTRVPRQVPALL